MPACKARAVVVGLRGSPAALQSLYTETDALDLPPSPVEVFFKTPIGPVLLINLAFLVTGFSWCDTPFGDPAACASLGK